MSWDQAVDWLIFPAIVTLVLVVAGIVAARYIP
jgi:hypothetical protein